jgi:hypothetical protein
MNPFFGTSPGGMNLVLLVLWIYMETALLPYSYLNSNIALLERLSLAPRRATPLITFFPITDWIFLT